MDCDEKIVTIRYCSECPYYDIKEFYIKEFGTILMRKVKLYYCSRNKIYVDLRMGLREHCPLPNYDKYGYKILVEE